MQYNGASLDRHELLNEEWVLLGILKNEKDRIEAENKEN